MKRFDFWFLAAILAALLTGCSSQPSPSVTPTATATTPTPFNRGSYEAVFIRGGTDIFWLPNQDIREDICCEASAIHVAQVLGMQGEWTLIRYGGVYGQSEGWVPNGEVNYFDRTKVFSYISVQGGRKAEVFSRADRDAEVIAEVNEREIFQVVSGAHPQEPWWQVKLNDGSEGWVQWQDISVRVFDAQDYPTGAFARLILEPYPGSTVWQVVSVNVPTEEVTLSDLETGNLLPVHFSRVYSAAGAYQVASATDLYLLPDPASEKKGHLSEAIHVTVINPDLCQASPDYPFYGKSDWCYVRTSSLVGWVPRDSLSEGFGYSG